MREADRLAERRFKIPPLLLMEHAAIGVAQVAMGEIRRRVARGTGTARVLIACGPGNNGGDGLAVARLLANRGMDQPALEVRVLLAHPAKACNALCAVQLGMVRALGVSVVRWLGDARVVRGYRPDLIIDAIFGTGLSRPLAPRIGALVRAINACGAHGPARAQRRATPARVISIDVPTGIDADTGLPPAGSVPATSADIVRADRTVVLGAFKPGLLRPRARAFTGSLTLADVGLPRLLVGTPSPDAPSQRR